MKNIIIVLTITLSSLRGELNLFPKGEKPPVSLKEAAEIFEKNTKKIAGIDFNPSASKLYGSRTPSAGTWEFIQDENDGKRYRYVLYFPEDLCVILNDKKAGQDAFVVAFSRGGKVIPRKNTEWGIDYEKDDPFMKPRKNNLDK